MANAITEARDHKIKALEVEMLAWVEGRRSWTNSIRGTSATQDNAWETMLIAQADAAEVMKLSAAIVALRANS